MIIARLASKLRAIVTLRSIGTWFAMLVAALTCIVGVWMGLTEEGNMNEKDFQISIGAQRVTFAAPPILKDGNWLVPLEPFAKRLGLKVEYPEGAEMVVLCGGVASERCVPLEFQDSGKGVVDIDGVTYVQPVLVAEPFGFQVYEVSASRLEVVQPMHLAPEFTLPDLEGTPKRLHDFRGKKTLLYVWGSW